MALVSAFTLCVFFWLAADPKLLWFDSDLSRRIHATREFIAVLVSAATWRLVVYGQYAENLTRVRFPADGHTVQYVLASPLN